MNSMFLPKGRRSIPKELLQFGKHLVYSEGTRTEPYYIANIKKNIANKYNCPQNAIQLIVASSDKKSYHTIDLVNFAKEDVKTRMQNGQEINHVWIFFDKDDFNDFKESHMQIILQNNSNKDNDEGFKFDEDTGITWHSCWSNACFELWLCLYFSFYHVPTLNRKEYKRYLESQSALKKIGFKYEKNLDGIHDILSSNGGSLENAIKYARKLEIENNQSNPSTGVYKFAEYFNPYMKKD